MNDTQNHVAHASSPPTVHTVLLSGIDRLDSLCWCNSDSVALLSLTEQAVCLRECINESIQWCFEKLIKC